MPAAGDDGGWRGWRVFGSETRGRGCRAPVCAGRHQSAAPGRRARRPRGDSRPCAAGGGARTASSAGQRRSIRREPRARRCAGEGGGPGKRPRGVIRSCRRGKRRESCPRTRLGASAQGHMPDQGSMCSKGAVCAASCMTRRGQVCSIQRLIFLTDLGTEDPNCCLLLPCPHASSYID